MSEKVEGFRPEELAANPAFQASCIQAVQSAARTVETEKRDMLRNAVLNSVNMTVDETIRHLFMQYVDRLTATHVQLLRVFHEPSKDPELVMGTSSVSMGSLSQLVDIKLPKLRGEPDITKALLADLESMSLLDNAGLNTGMSRDGLLASRTTKLGSSFLAFVSEPMP